MRLIGMGRLKGQAGTAYVEYFIAAAIMATAVLWLWDDGDLQGATAIFQAELVAQRDGILGQTP